MRRRRYVLLGLGAALVSLVGASSGPAGPPVEWLAFTGGDMVGLSGANIELITLDGSQRLNLTQSRTLNQQNSSWSPDGQRLAFDGGHFPQIRIYTIKADGSGLRRISGARNTGSFDRSPTWSPNGRWIAFNRSAYLQDATFLVRPDGSGLREWRLPRPGVVPVWSPDGRRIAFTDIVRRRGRDGRIYGQSEIFVANADGSSLKRLTYSPKDDAGPAWSPDGTRIAFTTTRNARLLEQSDVYVMNADGSRQTRLTENQAPPDGDFLLGVDGGPSWSPDGTRIAFTSGRDGNFDLYLMNADGSCETRLTQTEDIGENDVAWRPAPDNAGAGPLTC